MSKDKFDEIKDEKGNSLIMVAVQNGNPEILQLLLRQGALVNEQNHEGNTAFHFAVQCKRRRCQEILLAEGADESIENHEG